MLRRLRIIIAIVMLVLITLFLLGSIRMAWLAQIQLLPALLGLNVGVLVLLLGLTWVTGRTYCSVICPMGILQDVVDRVSRLFCRKKANRYSRPKNILRYAILALGIAGYVAQLFYVPAILDPYSSYGRMVNHLLKPLWLMINNWLVGYNEQTGWWLTHETFVAQSYAALILASATLLLIGLFAWLWGRTYCNTVCPVGTILGTLSRYSLFRVRIDTAKCNHCGLCARRCKSSCIDSRESKIDYSRCVVCFDCLDRCRRGALSFGLRRKASGSVAEAVSAGSASHSQSAEAALADVAPVDVSRRSFLVTAATALVATPIAVAQGVTYETTTGKRWQKSITTMMDGEVAAERYWAIMPPGTVARDRFQRMCTSCHLCVSHCPSHILKPAVREYGLEGIMQPTVSYENGYCRPDCNVCGQVCPSGAIKPLTIDRKRKDKLGWANFNSKTCITQTDDVECGNCARHCPNKAIQLVEKNGHKVPKVIVSLCTGCGACEYYCPARPKAIHVEGLMY